MWLRLAGIASVARLGWCGKHNMLYFVKLTSPTSPTLLNLFNLVNLVQPEP
jgi:hypothetical protein